jgi:acetyl-CoA carboxylase carboxyltransferase component
MSWQAELDELARRKAFAERMGGADKVKRQHDGGRLTVRERIEKLTDPGSFHEIGAIAGKAEYDEHGELIELVPSNCVFGAGPPMPRSRRRIFSPSRWPTSCACRSSG